MKENKFKRIDKELLLAYEQALYKLNNPSILFKINKKNDALKTFLSQKDMEEAFFITAYNPGSELSSTSLNEKNNERLYEKLQDEKCLIFQGSSESPDGNWPVEHSFFIINISKEKVLTLAREFGQMAIVQINKNGLSSLLWC